ncbi:MAG: glucose-1-phosphate thymidylyltransferase [Pyrobaculum sp.]
MFGLVLVAGIGERMRPLSYSIPKPLVSVLGRPVVGYVLERLAGIGVSKVGVVVGRLAEAFQERLGDGSQYGLSLTYIRQERRLGIAHAIYRGVEEGFLRGEFVVALGDNYFSEPFGRFARAFLEGRHDVHIVLTRHPQPQRFGNAVVEGGRVVRLVEKPPSPLPNSYVVAGLYFFRDPDLVARAFRDLKPSARGEYEITDLIQWFVDRGFSVGYTVTEGWWKDTGTPEDLLELMQLMLDESRPKVEGEVRGAVNGRVIVERGAVVEGVVHGPAYVGRDAYVGRGAEVEHFVSLEEGAAVEGGSLSRTLVLEGARLSLGKARLTDSVVGPRSLISLRNGRHRLVVGEAVRIEEL